MNSARTGLPMYATCSPEDAQRHQENTIKGMWDLLPSEERWREREPFLRQKGYILRPRYQKGWSPSWLGTQRDPDFCEDSIYSRVDHVLDATRSADGSLVSIKVVKRDNNEIDVAQYLSRPEFLHLPENHAVPVLSVFTDPLNPTEDALLIMPYLRPFNNPEFGAIGEVIEFVRQTLEGLAFLHSVGIAHRDCASANIMMDARSLFPQGHHPARLNYTPDAVFDAPHLPRLDHPVKYFFIDFGLSSRFHAGESPNVLGTKGRDKDAPELSNTVPYNAFMLDIFILGNVYRKEFLDKFYGLELLEPLVSSMLNPVPERRPSASAASMDFTKVRSTINTSLYRRRLRSRNESAPERVMYDTVAAAKQGIYHLKRLVA